MNTHRTQPNGPRPPAFGKRSLLLLAFITATIPNGHASGRIETVGPAAVDLGTFRAWTRKTAHYTVRNAGHEPLTIRSVKAACACAVTTVTRKELRTGEEAQIDVEVIPNSIFGHFRKAVYVESSDAQRRFLNLEIKGNAVPMVSVVPKPYMHAGQIETNTAWSQSFDLAGNTAGLTLGQPETRSSHPVKTSLVRLSDPESAYRLDLKLAPVRESGDFRCFVRIPVTTPTNGPDVEVSIQARIGVALMAFPSVLELPRSAEEPVVRTFMLRLPRSTSVDPSPDRLTRPDHEGAEFEVSREQGARGLVVRATFTPQFVKQLAEARETGFSFGLPGAASAEVTLRTCNPSTP